MRSDSKSTTNLMGGPTGRGPRHRPGSEREHWLGRGRDRTRLDWVLNSLFVLTVFFSLALFPKAALAQYGQYQPGPSYSILIDKLVGVPSSSNGSLTYNYVDNLGLSDYKFKPENYVFFKVKIKNTSSVKLENLVIKDTAPSYIDLFDEPGTFDASTRVLTINVGSLEAGAEKEYIVRTRVMTADKLPATDGTVCVTNAVTASNDKVSDSDNAQLCIEKAIQGASYPTTAPIAASKIPSAGPEYSLAILGLSGLIGALGIRLRKIN